MPHERTVRIVRYERASALLRAPSTRQAVRLRLDYHLEQLIYYPYSS